jgi:hypothetical protein
MRLAGVRRRFEAWRATHERRSRIPAPLWRSAVKMAGLYGLHRTATALRLDYYALKKRLEQETPVSDGAAAIPAAGSKREAVTPFLELVPPLSAAASECFMELENAAGAKMRVHLKGVASPGTLRRMVVAALSRSFGNRQP